LLDSRTIKNLFIKLTIWALFYHQCCNNHQLLFD
jgi:hypothetical protein